MDNPGIEIAWGGGIWRKNQKRVIEEPIRCAKDLATYGLEHLGVSYEMPKKLTVFKVAKHCIVAGESKGPVDMDIHIPVHHIKYRKVAAMIAELAETVLHETTHCIRSERYDFDTLVETAASEGLAYVSEDIVSNALLPAIEASYLGSCIERATSAEYDMAKASLLDCSDLSVPNTPDALAIYEEWFCDDGSGIPPGVLIGVTEVYRRLAEGNTIADMMSWPAEEILDLNTSFMTSADRL